ncbi:MAG: pyridoxamine 5'-phosphate oxidase family protein [Planctomycetota bacterium]
MNETTANHDPSDRKQVIDVLTQMIAENHTAMLVTSGGDHIIRSRPMVNVNERFDGELNFIAAADGEICRSLFENPRCNISISEPTVGNFVSLTGTASVEDNPKKLELIWNSACKRWFDSDSPPDNLRLIKVDVEEGELWNQDLSLSSRISSLLNLKGATIDHATVGWPETPDRSNPTSIETSPTLSLINHHSK